MHDSTKKTPTSKNLYTNHVSDEDHDFRARKHAQNHPIEDPGYSSSTWWTPSSIKLLNPLHDNDHKSQNSLQHDHDGNDHKCHESRIEAIERGQKELMEMAIKMTEPSMELSMTGLVELETPTASPENERLDEKCLLSNGDVQRKIEVNNTRKNKQKKTHIRSSNVENGGLLLKIICPFSMGYSTKKTKKNVRSSGSECNSNERDSPKALLDDKEWWNDKAGESGCGGSSTYSTSKSSSDSSHSHTNICRSHNEGCCWAFLCTRERHGRGN